MANQVKHLEQSFSPEAITNTKDLVFFVANLCEDKKAEDTEVLDISKIAADLADFVIITSADTAPQLKAVSRHIEDTLAKMGMEPEHKEGKYGDTWFLLDYVDFIVHVINTESREFYNLEELWAKAKFIPDIEWRN